MLIDMAEMDCANILNIIGNIASIITVIGGIYGLCKWVSSRKAKIKVTQYRRDERYIYILYICNDGPADAYNIKISAASKYEVETGAYISKLSLGEEGQLGFAFRQPVSLLSVYIHWADGMGWHKKRVQMKSLMQVR